GPAVAAGGGVGRGGGAGPAAGSCADGGGGASPHNHPPPAPPRPAAALPPLTTPLVPLAVLSQPCLPAENVPECWRKKDANTWERRIMAPGGTDEWEMNPNPPKGQPILPIRTQDAKGDGIPERKVNLCPGRPREEH